MATPPTSDIDGAGPSPLPPRPGTNSPFGPVSTARFDDQQLVKAWLGYLRAASKVYKSWADEFEVETLEQMFYGFQWNRQGNELTPEQRYVVNLFFSDLETKLPALLFNRPGVIAQARPPFADDPSTNIMQRVQLLKDTADTLLVDPRSRFRPSHGLALKDSFFRYGVIGAFYDQNPLLSHVPSDLPPRQYGKKDMTRGDGTGVGVDLSEGVEGQTAQMDDDESAEGMRDTPQEEMGELGAGGLPGVGQAPPPVDGHAFFRWIPSKQFRVPAVNHNSLDENSWCAFYEWHPLADVKNNEFFDQEAREHLRPGGLIADFEAMSATNPPGRSTTATSAPATSDADDKGQYVQVWWIWDIREKKRMVLTPSSPLPLLAPEPYTTLPFSCLKFYERLGSFYPIPPCWNWKHPQRQINQEREDSRIHRRRFYRRYGMVEDVLDEQEMSKLESGGDGVVVTFRNLGARGINEAFQPIQDAPRDPQNNVDAATLMTDMRMMSNVGGEQKGTADAKTATQAALVETNARLRQSAEKEVVAIWVGGSITIIIKTAVEFYPADFWIKTNVDVYGVGGAEEMMRVGGLWKQIKLAELDDFEWEIGVDVESLTPETSELQRQQWSQVIGLFSQPNIMLLLLCSDMLLRKTLALYGIRSSKDVIDIKRAMQVGLLAQGLQVAVAAAEQANAMSMQEDGVQGPGGGGMMDLSAMLGGAGGAVVGGVPGGDPAQIAQGGVGATATPGVGAGAPTQPANPLMRLLAGLVGQGGGMQGGIAGGGGR